MRHVLVFAILFLVFINSAFADSPIEITSNPSKTVETGKQIQIAADLQNNQDFEQDFAYIVQIQNKNGVTVSLAWLTGTLQPAQSFSPAISWIPNEAGQYEATIFVWESINNPSALSHTLTMEINVGQAA
jgi:hypothetical protein